METVGRDPEREGIDRWLSAPEGILVIEGEPGIGKSTLCRAAVAEAESRGYRVLACAAVGAETQLAFTTLRDLLEPIYDEIADELPPPQRQALAVCLLRESPGPSPPEDGAVAVALLTALTTLGTRGPTLVVVDDAQWIDDASAGPLGYALRRLESTNVAVLLTRRVDEDVRPLSTLPQEGRRTVTLGAVSVGALARILHERLGTAYARPTLHRLHETSGGNPLYALELARALGEGAPLGPTAALPVPATLHELVDKRLIALPRDTREALLVASALARPTLETVAAVVGHDPLPELEPAIGAHVAEAENGMIRFSHPLFAAAVYGLAAPAERQALHRRLADVVSEPEERARHLALSTSEPSVEIADELDRAAGGAHARIVAAELYEAAATLTPTSDARTRARRRMAAAAATFDAGDAESARRSLEALVEESPEGSVRVDAQLILGRILADVGRPDEATRLWNEALAATDDDRRIADIRSCMVTLALYTGGPGEALEHARQAVAAASRSRDTARLAYAYAAHAAAGLNSGDPTYRRFLQDALELERDYAVRGSAWDWSPSNVAAACALRAFDIDEMNVRFGELHQKGRATGNADLEQYGAYGLALAALAAADAARASELAGVVDELVAVTGAMRTPGQRLRAEIDAHLGNAQAARASLSAVAAEAQAHGEMRHAWQVRVALGALELADGQAPTASVELRAARALADGLGMGEPWVLASLVDEVEAAAEAGLDAQAREARAAASLLGAPVSWQEPLLLRADAILLMHAGDLEAAEALLMSSLTVEASSRLPVQHARTGLLLGRAQRRARKLRAARATLEQTLGRFEQIGAELWATRAREELGRIGGRSPAPGDLTPAEERVAALVAEGRSNKEVAAVLVVSVHTVEAALTSIYRKLDVHSRTEMARKLAPMSKD